MIGALVNPWAQAAVSALIGLYAAAGALLGVLRSVRGNDRATQQRELAGRRKVQNGPSSPNEGSSTPWAGHHEPPRRKTRPHSCGSAIAASPLTSLAAVAAITRDQDRAALLSNAGLALLARFERTGNPDDLDQAINTSQAAVDASRVHDPERPRYLSNFGGALHARFERSADLADLDAAVGAVSDAVNATPADHPDRAGYLSNSTNNSCVVTRCVNIMPVAQTRCPPNFRTPAQTTRPPWSGESGRLTQ
jgi:hypothetical protein